MHSIRTDNITCNQNMLIIRFGEVLKTTRPGHHLHEIILPAFDQTPSLCVVRAYKSYLTFTQGHRSTPQLFLQSIKPFKGIKRDTYGSWVKSVMTEAGVDMSVFPLIRPGQRRPVQPNRRGPPSQYCILQAGLMIACSGSSI